jgi:AmmeMemoRadiSam system protein B
MTSALRTPAVAGRFYPSRTSELLHDVRQYTSLDGDRDGDRDSDRNSADSASGRIGAIGCVVPHAGYMYSGGVAGAVYAEIEIPERCVILCPNHTGKGVPLSIMADTAWQTPLGTVAADAEMSRRLIERFPALQEDSAAHCSEHAIEVQLPFLQVRQPELKIVPIALGMRDFEVLRGLGEALADVVGASEKNTGMKILIVASSDMNHYEADSITRFKDRKAIARVLAMDARGLWEVVIGEGISMCGLGPTIVMLTAAKILGATSATLVKYATSGDVSGDYEAVVGYAGIIVA